MTGGRLSDRIMPTSYETAEVEIKPRSALTESRGCWKPGRKRPGKWTTKGKGKGRKPEYPDRMPALRAGDVMASLTRRTFPFENGNVNKGGTARLIIPALSFEKDRAVFIAGGSYCETLRTDAAEARGV